MQTWEGLVGVVYKILRAKGRSNSQQTVLGVVASVLIVVCKWMKQLSTNNVGSCCVLVDSGVQTDATTPNNAGPSQVLVRHAKLLLCCLQGDYVLAHHRCWSVTRSYCFAVSKETMCNARSWWPQQCWESCATL